MQRLSSTEPCVLLVEGESDKHVIQHLVSRVESPPCFSICVKKGVDKLLDSLGPELKVSGRKILGIVVDANDNPHARWDEIRQRLRSEGIKLPRKPDQAGTIIRNRIRVGIWMMPDNGNHGELEDFVEELIPSSDPCWQRARDYIESIPETERKFPKSKTAKARVGVWFATRRRPGMIREAFRIGDLSPSTRKALKLTSWLKELYSE